MPRGETRRRPTQTKTQIPRFGTSRLGSHGLAKWPDWPDDDSAIFEKSFFSVVIFSRDARARPHGVAQGVSPFGSPARSRTHVRRGLRDVGPRADRRAAVPFPRRDLRRERLRPAPRAGAPARDPGGALRGGARIRDRRVRRRGGPRHAGHGVGLPLDGAPEHIVPRVLPRGVLAVLPRARGERGGVRRSRGRRRGPPGGARGDAPHGGVPARRGRSLPGREAGAQGRERRGRAQPRHGRGHLGGRERARVPTRRRRRRRFALGRRRERPRRLRGRRQPELVPLLQARRAPGDARAERRGGALGRGRRR